MIMLVRINCMFCHWLQIKAGGVGQLIHGVTDFCLDNSLLNECTMAHLLPYFSLYGQMISGSTKYLFPFEVSWKGTVILIPTKLPTSLHNGILQSIGASLLNWGFMAKQFWHVGELCCTFPSSINGQRFGLMFYLCINCHQKLFLSWQAFKIFGRQLLGRTFFSEVYSGLGQAIPEFNLAGIIWTATSVGPSL